MRLLRPAAAGLAMTYKSSHCEERSDESIFMNLWHSLLLSEPDLLEFNHLFRVGAWGVLNTPSGDAGQTGGLHKTYPKEINDNPYIK